MDYTNTIIAIAALITALGALWNGRRTKTDLVRDYQEIALHAGKTERELRYQIRNLYAENKELKQQVNKLTERVSILIEAKDTLAAELKELQNGSTKGK